jgi:hypothetical protein
MLAPGSERMLTMRAAAHKPLRGTRDVVQLGT